MHQSPGKFSDFGCFQTVVVPDPSAEHILAFQFLGNPAANHHATHLECSPVPAQRHPEGNTRCVAGEECVEDGKGGVGVGWG